MPLVPPCGLRFRWWCLLLVLAVTGGVARARGPEPVARVDLRALGYQDFSQPMLDSGAALVTTHYVDDRHLLVTFSRRRLMPRIADDPPDDMDRNLDVLLLELPSGKVVARTAWRAHDIGQYLWSLGEGRFLLRLQNRLVTISPMRRLAEGGAFEEHPLLNTTRQIGALFVSADGKLLTLETLDRRAGGAEARSPSPRTRAYAAAAAEAESERPDPNPVQVNFFRIQTHEETGLPFAQSAGQVRSPALILVPVDGAGFIATLDQGHQHYAFDFLQHTGKRDELSPFDSTCQPAPMLVNRSEFIALGCRSGAQLQVMGGFNLRGEEMWEQVLPEAYVNPTFAFAPPAGRFAFGRVVVSANLDDRSDALSRNLGVYPTTNQTAAGQIQSQAVSVFQMETGRVLFTISCAPVLRGGGNFALRPDGGELAVVRNGAVELYRLPPPSAKEQKLMTMAATYAPERNEAPIHLNGRAAVALPTPAEERQTAGVVPGAGGGNAGSGAGAAPAAPAPAAGAAGARRDAVTSAASEEPNGTDAAVAMAAGKGGAGSGAPAKDAGVKAAGNGDADAAEGERRKPPTLYGPGEKPAAGDAKPADPQ